MVNEKKAGYLSPFAIHPGETIKESLEFNGMSQVDLSVRANLSEKTISLILNGSQPVTPETALKLERALGLSRELLLGMQARYNEDVFRLKEEERLKNEVQYLHKYFFYPELANLGYVEKTRSNIKKVEELLKFFGINSLDSVQTVFSAAFRISHKHKASSESLAAWLRIGEIEADNKYIESFNRQKLMDSLQEMRSLTVKNASDFSTQLTDLCAKSGVVLVFTPHLKNTCVNGASRWLSPDKALVQISLYHKYADIFWFTLFHELGHLLRHGKKETFVDLENQNISEVEQDADIFAQQLLIPVDKEPEYQELKKSDLVDIKKRIRVFSEDIGVDAGIVAGRLGREMGIWKYVAPLRTRLEFK